MINELQPVEYDHIRVLTTQQLAESYETTNKVISNNFNNNKNYYQIGKHYFLLKGKELKEFKSESLNLGIANNINTLYLWTERGAFYMLNHLILPRLGNYMTSWLIFILKVKNIT
ncbi:ORF6N domain-containing protein [Coprobacillaceae bacterium CR2/5/TPMF4]|nr:ORF6N domain-containing protein [Coprobacillaceae bacterium CR2/5/TPMF4]